MRADRQSICVGSENLIAQPPEDSSVDERPSRNRRLVLFLLIGSLSMFYTEVFAGSAPLWFISWWGLLVTFPLYLVHLLFFLNIAMRTRRTSVGHLYLFGVFIALYESWITKVLWSGYPGAEGPLEGTFLGIASLEFSVLVFFWHPVFAFVLPILTFEALAISVNSRERSQEKIFGNHGASLKKDPKLLGFLTFAGIVGDSFLSANTGSDAVLAGLTVLGSVILIALLYQTARRNPNDFSIHSLRLKRKGMTTAAIYLALLYGFTLPFLQPDKIPDSPLPILIIGGFYVLLALLVRMSPPDKALKGKPDAPAEPFSSKDFFEFCLLFLLLTTLFCVMPTVGGLVTIVLNSVLFVVGPFIFIIIVARLLMTRH